MPPIVPVRTLPVTEYCLSSKFFPPVISIWAVLEDLPRQIAVSTSGEISCKPAFNFTFIFEGHTE